jgi:hypothetical protein
LLTGAALGSVVALTADGLIQGQLFGVRPADPATFTAVVPCSGIVAILASLVPVRRATRVEPMQAPRLE